MKKVFYMLILVFIVIPIFVHGDSLKVIANPSQRSYSNMIMDVTNNRCVLFGGGLPWFKFYNDVWSLDLADDTWHPVYPSGNKPQPRFMGAAIYYRPQNAMIVIGGRTNSTYYNDVWQLILSPGTESWHLISASGTPPSSRSSYSCIVDTVNSRMILFGGEYNGSFYNTIYCLDLNTWTWSQLSPSGTPPAARFEHSAIYDPQGQRMIVFGGYDGIHYNDIWALSLIPGSESWTLLYPTGTAPALRGRHFCSFDPLQRQMIIGFGYDASSLYNDVWSLNLNALSWSRIVSFSEGPDGRRGAVSSYAPSGQKAVIFGGDLYNPYNDSWYYSAETYALVIDTLGISHNHLRTIYPNCLINIQQNPIKNSCSILFNFSPGVPVTVQIYNDIGKLTKTICENKMITRINERMDWDCTDSQGRRVPAGIYFVKARTIESEEDQKVIVLNPK